MLLKAISMKYLFNSKLIFVISFRVVEAGLFGLSFTARLLIETLRLRLSRGIDKWLANIEALRMDPAAVEFLLERSNFGTEITDCRRGSNAP
jgi:hypothetical protein